MTKEEIRAFRDLFRKYCNQEISNGYCQEHSCSSCLVNGAYYEIFDRFTDEEENDSDDS